MPRPITNDQPEPPGIRRTNMAMRHRAGRVRGAAAGGGRYVSLNLLLPEPLMSTPLDPASQLVARLARLERQHRQLRRIALGGLCLLPLVLAAFSMERGAPIVQV